MPTKKALSPGQIVAKQIRAARSRQGLSQEAVADLMKKYGHPIDRVTLAKIEAGGTRARNIKLEEALALAAVLSVPPAVFFLGLGTEERVAITPEMTVHPGLAAKWLRGAQEPATSERFSHRRREWMEAARPVFLHDKLEEAQGEALNAYNALQRAEYAGEESLVQRARARYADALRDLGKVLDEMDVSGFNWPKMPEYEKDMAALGIRGRS
jgi:transcriptional regulator with XRE-family HTH domain